MTAPNLKNINNIIGKTAHLAITDSPTAIISNGTNSNKVFKINSININGNSEFSTEITVDIYDGTTSYPYGSTIVPADATLEFMVNKPLYLEEGKSLRIKSNITDRANATVSYEEIY